MSLKITEELIARQPAEAQAIIRVLLAKIAELGRGIEIGSKPNSDDAPTSSWAAIWLATCRAWSRSDPMRGWQRRPCSR